MNVYDSIINLKGIGEKTLHLYKKLDIETVNDLTEYYPRDYYLCEKADVLNGSTIEGVVVFKARVISQPLVKRVKRLDITSCKLQSGRMIVNATWFHMSYLSKSLRPGEEYVFRGTVSLKGEHYVSQQPQIFTLSEYSEIEEHIMPVYSLTKGLTNKAIGKSVKLAFDYCESYDKDKYQMHFPSDYATLAKARNNLVYDEFITFILGLRLMKDSNDRAMNDFNISTVPKTQEIIDNLPYKLTDAQQRVWSEVEADLCKNHSMSRLVQGDVGSGKTIISFLATIMAGLNGYQSAIMAPTEILARQHYEGLKKLLEENNVGLKTVLLTGSNTAKEKREIKKAILDNEYDIVIGTHALIQDSVQFNKPALVVTDEQHRFGVKQREKLLSKGEGNVPHVLVMSATPIPRTLAIILYGDLDISVIDELPAARLPIKNCVVKKDYRKKSYEFIEKEIRNGHQAYVICPLVEESEGLDATDVTSYSKELESVFDNDVQIGVLHGKMTPSKKQSVMEAFLRNEINILVSTTVVEVGVNVPNATVMMIEDANRFGLAQLHQLRGRIGRGAAQSYCIFMCSDNSAKSLDRLDILNKSNDGFQIASEDLKQRGPGDMLGIRQSGMMQFRLGDVYADAAILKKACDDVEAILKDDPRLEKEINRKYQEQILNMKDNTTCGVL